MGAADGSIIELHEGWVRFQNIPGFLLSQARAFHELEAVAVDTGREGALREGGPHVRDFVYVLHCVTS